MDLLETITALSYEFGGTDFVRGGGGNTSCKTADTIWVKPSGTTLGAISPERFVPMDRRKLSRLYEMTPPNKPKDREALVQKIMGEAVLPGATGRPSVEAPLHQAFDATYVVHVHPTFVTGMVAAREGEAACRRLFPDALWLPYCDPGYVLSMRCRQAMKEYAEAQGEQPSVVFLQNHGVFVAGDAPEQVSDVLHAIREQLGKEYAAKGVAVKLPIGPRPDDRTVASTAARLKEVMGGDAAHVSAGGVFTPAVGPISPDHVVYAKSYPFLGEPKREALEGFRAERRYWPRVIVTGDGVYGVGATVNAARLALEFAEDGALVRQLAAAFGGIRYLDDRSRDFIEGWEVESYRQRVAEGPVGVSPR